MSNVILRGKRSLRLVERDVRALLALLGGITFFLVVITILCLFITRQPTPILATLLESAMAPLIVAVVQYVRPARNGERGNRQPETGNTKP